jgi:hypothetical protein
LIILDVIFYQIYILTLVFGPIILLGFILKILLNIFEKIIGKKTQYISEWDFGENLICFTLLPFCVVGLVMKLCELVGTYLY